ncbi:FAD-dependent oxidoreductase [Achromobacter xylosoxidans]
MTRASTAVGSISSRSRCGAICRAAPAGEPEAWAGLRPARPDGKPLIERTPVRGLWINAGHGALGFTLAAGSAGVLADRIAGRPSPISDTLFQW